MAGSGDDEEVVGWEEMHAETVGVVIEMVTDEVGGQSAAVEDVKVLVEWRVVGVEVSKGGGGLVVTVDVEVSAIVTGSASSRNKCVESVGCVRQASDKGGEGVGAAMGA